MLTKQNGGGNINRQITYKNYKFHANKQGPLLSGKCRRDERKAVARKEAENKQRHVLMGVFS